MDDKKSVVLEELLRDRELTSTEYVLPNIAMSEQEKIDLAHEIERSKKSLVIILNKAAEAFNEDTPEHKDTLKDVIPVLREIAGSETAVAIGMYNYFNDKMIAASKKQKAKNSIIDAYHRMAGSVSNVFGKTYDFFAENPSGRLGYPLLITGICVGLAFGGYSGVRGMISCSRQEQIDFKKKADEENVKYESEFAEIQKKYDSIDDSLADDKKIDALRQAISAEVKFLIDRNKLFVGRDSTIELRNQSINDYSHFLVVNKIPPKEGIRFVRYMIESTSEDGIEDVFNWSKTYLSIALANNLPLESAMDYLEKSKDPSSTTEKIVTAAAKFFISEQKKSEK